MAAQLVVALDVDNRSQALELARQLIPATPWMKVGLELFTACGPDIVAQIKKLGGKVFFGFKISRHTQHRRACR